MNARLSRVCALFLFIILCTSPLFSSHMLQKCHHHEHIILLLLPRGDLARELKLFEEAVQSSDLFQQIFKTLPAHSKLTPFIRKIETDTKYVKELLLAIADLKRLDHKISICGLKHIHHYHPQDFIQLKSVFTFTLAAVFLQRLGLDPNILLDKSLSRIVLNDRNFKDHMQRKRIRVLEEVINLKAEAKWSLFLYKVKRNKYHLLKEIHL